MKLITVQGGRRLCGTVWASGSKNAALPILFATLVTRGISVIRRMPDIGDTRVAISILSSLGASVSRTGDTVTVDTRDLRYCDPPSESISAIRASTYLLGASLSRFGMCRISDFGGCNFSLRPIDMHIQACLAFGGEMEGDVIRAGALHGTEITFAKKSVGATINSIILASSAHGRTVIRGHAMEPHVRALVNYLISAGASITMSDSEIRVEGRELHGGDISVIGDMIEAGSYLAAGVITGGEVSVGGCDPSDLQAFLSSLTDLGARVSVSDGVITAACTGRPGYFTVTAAPYPSFPTDLQPIVAPLMAFGEGGRVYDTVWESRYGYLSSLTPFGLRYSVDTEGACIFPSQLIGAHTESTDLRGGMAAVLCALAAEGESVIGRADLVLRGYEMLESKMRSLGAEITIDISDP